MTSTSNPDLAPRFEVIPARRLAGLRERYDMRHMEGIPMQWQRFAPYLTTMPGRVGDASYGVSDNFDQATGMVDYMAAVAVRNDASLPDGIVSVDLPEQRYAIFASHDHISGIRAFIASVWSTGIPKSGATPVRGAMLERYGPEYDAASGTGGFEIWVPVQK